MVIPEISLQNNRALALYSHHHYYYYVSHQYKIKRLRQLSNAIVLFRQL